MSDLQRTLHAAINRKCAVWDKEGREEIGHAMAEMQMEIARTFIAIRRSLGSRKGWMTRRRIGTGKN